jgi:hypothetical protein
MKPVAQMLIGSQNYQLDGPDSDFDYKLLMMPDFNDFYNYHKVDKNDLPDGYDPEHYNVMSILTFDKNVRKGNVNALEMLFSHYIKCVGDIETYIDAAKRAYAEGYLFIVWDSFIATVEGMIKNSLDRYGVNRKSASRALYLINLCYFVAEHDFAMDNTTWKEKQVFADARELRFNEDKELPTKEAIFATFEDMKRFADNCRNYHRLMYSESELNLIAAWDDDLATCMKNTVKGYLRKEL